MSEIRPSERLRTPHLRSPKGCLDVWEIRIRNLKARNTYQTLAIVEEESFAYELADEYWNKQRQDRHGNTDVWVNHRSAILIEGKYHIVNKPSFKIQSRPLGKTTNSHDDWYPADTPQDARTVTELTTHKPYV